MDNINFDIEEFIDRIKNSEFVEKIKSGEYIDKIKNSEFAEKIRNGEYADRIKNSEIAEKIKNSEYTEKVKKAEVVKKAVGMYREMTAMLDSVKDRDPAAESRLEVAALYPGVHAVATYRITHFLHVNGFRVPARALSQLSRALTGIEIHPGATIGKRLFIDHGMGVVIGETSVIGDDCTIYQGVTLGGTGKDNGKRHPTLGNNVMIGAGAKVLGPVNIGDNVKIASGAVVISDIPADSTAVGVPARVVRKNGERVEYDLDQIHFLDPVSQNICKLEHRIDMLQKELDNITGKKPATAKKTGQAGAKKTTAAKKTSAKSDTKSGTKKTSAKSSSAKPKKKAGEDKK